MQILRLLKPWVLVLLVALSGATGHAATANSISQYGVTWTFDKAYPVGRFVTGDWWVVGPVMVVSVSPAPGPAPATEPATSAKSIYGATSLVDDKRYRNGSMVIAGQPQGGFANQGYDSRAINYDPALAIAYPYQLAAGQSLLSSISSEVYDNQGTLATPYIVGQLMPNGMAHASEPLALDTIAVLTCLSQAPPADAFRPAYAGADKTIYETKDIRWDLLPSLKPVASTPDWDKIIRIYQRPWIDHIDNWTVQATGPGQNQAAYGGVVTRMNAIASLMLLLDGPKEKKQQLAIEFLQYGIDLHGLANAGRQWFSDGGHWMGRKWPLLFTSLMLNKPELRTFPPAPLGQPIYGRVELDAGSEGPAPTTFFSEDLDTYYGKGAAGQNVLWQVVYHTCARAPYQEKPYADWNGDDKFIDGYMWTPGNWGGMALAALYLKAKATWDHDAFFDYCDWYMAPGQTLIKKDGSPQPTRYNTQPFVLEMWDAYRAGAPTQAGGVDNVKWVWTDGKMIGEVKGFYATKGHFVQNPKAP